MLNEREGLYDLLATEKNAVREYGRQLTEVHDPKLCRLLEKNLSAQVRTRRTLSDTVTELGYDCPQTVSATEVVARRKQLEQLLKS